MLDSPLDARCVYTLRSANLFGKNLHENERIWIDMGRVSPASTGSATAVSKSGVNDAISSVTISVQVTVHNFTVRMWPPECKNLTKLL